MEVVSTSNLVSSETEKTTTSCNFQTMNSFVMSHDLSEVKSDAMQTNNYFL